VARERVVNRPGQLSGFAEVLGGGVLSCLLCGGLGFWLGMTFQRARLRKKLEEL
jgi:hypothetical protein